MDIGTGIAIASVAISAAAVGIKALGSDSKNSSTFSEAMHHKEGGICPVHHTVEESLKGIWAAIGIIQGDIKELLKRGL